MFYFSSLSWCIERLCSRISLRTKLGIWYPSRSSTMPYRKLRGLWISVRAPIKLLTDNSFCESKISCASQCFDQICASKSMSSTLLLPQYIVNTPLSLWGSLLYCDTLWLEHPQFGHFCLHLTACLGKLWLFSLRPNTRFHTSEFQLYQPHYFCVWGFRQIHLISESGQITVYCYPTLYWILCAGDCIRNIVLC